MHHALRASVLRDPFHLAAYGFGTGFCPMAPGTCGTLLAVPLCWALSAASLPVYLAVVIGSFGLGVWMCGRTARALNRHDDPGIVWDEIVGYLLAMAGTPPRGQWLLAGFLLFRFFDIVKPWPIGWLDRRVGGGLGIMLDDAVAGVYAALCLHGFAATI